MAQDAYSEPSLASTLKELFRDLSDLLGKEIRLARAELTTKLTTKVMSGVWMGVAGLLGFIALLFLLEALVFGIAALGLALHWASLIVALVLAVAAAGAFFYGR